MTGIRKGWAALICLVLCAAMMLCFGAAAEEAAQGGTDLVVVTTTDMHGRCWDANLLTGGKTINNMLHVSTAVKQIREEYGAENVLLIDNGDLFQGNPVSQVQLMRFFSGESTEPPAMALCLAEMKYDAFVLGNHEFNYEWNGMSAVYKYLEDNGISVLAGNACYDGTDGVHQAGDQAFTPYIIRTVTINGHEHKIGILGLENCDITRWDLPINYPGLQFVHPGNEEFSMAKEAALFFPKMKEEGCEMIIVAYHGGLGDLNNELLFGDNSESQGLRMASECEDIDLLIVGHDHITGYSNTYVSDKNGRQILVVNGGSQELTKTVFHMTENAEGALKWEITDTRNLNLGDYEADPELTAMIEPYAAIAKEKVEEPIGTTTGDWDESFRYYTQQTDTVDMVSAASMAVTTKRIQEAFGEIGPEGLGVDGLDHLDVDMSTTSVTTSGSYVVRPGNISVRDMYRLYRYDNNLLVLPMTGARIRAIMEENAANRLRARVYDGRAHIFAKGDKFTNIIFGGINFSYDLSREPGSRVQIRGFSNGRAFTDDGVYLVVVNNYLLGNERSALRDFTVEDAIWSQLEDADGETIQDIIAEYIRDVCAEKGSVTPDEFTWEWNAEYAADPAALPPYEGEVAATMAEKPEDGRSYILYYEPESFVMGPRETNGGYEIIPWEAIGSVLPAPIPENAEIFTAHINEDGLMTFTDQRGLYLTSAANSGLFLKEEMSPDNLSLWELIKVDGGYYLTCVGTGEEMDNRMALEYYGERFTTYRLDYTDIYLFNFYEVK